MSSILILLFYYWVITFSIIGYGILFNQFFLKFSEKDIGFIGINGIFILIFISYLTSFFIPHTVLFNSILILIGFSKFLMNIKNIQKNLKDIIVIFTILIIFIFVSKNHDDFPYYHFPYSYYLTQNNTFIGIGIFNHGFRTPSSLFYLSSVFYLPLIKYNLFLLPALLILGFANLILLSKIVKNLNLNKIDYSLYLCLFSLAFINIFFYRIQEHGTDRSAQILVFILFIDFLLFVSFRPNFKDNISNILVTLGIIISLKSFYILYLSFFIPIFFIF